MKQCRTLVMVGLVIILGVFIPCTKVKAEEARDEDIATILTNDERFHTISTLLKAAGLVDVLEGEGPYTVFLPSDDAFKTLPADTFTELIRYENKQKLEDLLTYHIYSKQLSKEKLGELSGEEILMLNNKKVKIACRDGNLYVNKAKIIVTDIPAANGIIHIIDTVLVPKG